MRDIKFSYILESHEHEGKNSFKDIRFDYQQVFDGEAAEELDAEARIHGYKVLAKRLYTGFKDKNSVEIYEGDIIEWDDYYFEGVGNGGTGYGEWRRKSGRVHFDTGMFCVGQEFALAMLIQDARVEDDSYEFEDDEETGWKVIGNIYENPELLEE